MKKWLKRQRFVYLFIGFFLISAFGIAALVGDSGQIYSALDKAYYLSAEDAMWIRPGLKLEILNVSIPADRKATVTFKITDERGFGLDRSGNLTPGSVSTSFLFAYIPQTSSQYVSYYTRTATSNINGNKAIQAATGAGTYVDKGDGVYTFTFSSAIPADYDTSATHTVGIYASRNLTEFGLSTYVDNATKNFVPNGAEVTKVREVANTANCNQCHDPLALHGGSRRDLEICILCHTPQTSDPDTGNTVDMKVMTHKIHRGADLPSVQAGKPYIIIGNRDSVHDYSTVLYPQDMRYCTTCHKDASQANNWFMEPTRDTCQSCHDDVDWTTGANHPGGPQASDNRCSSCHYPQGDYEWDASVMGAHTVPDNSTQLRKPKAEILEITNTGPGQKPTVKFRVTDKNGNYIAPNAMSRLTLRIAGPTIDYSWYRSETATGATSADNVATYTFTGALPSDAKGSYSICVDGRLATTLQSIKLGTFNYNDALPNVVKYFAVTGTTATPRRKVVDIARCNVCHARLQLHGNNRNDIEACVQCHNPTLTDASGRPESEGPAESVNFKYMIHKIHTGEELENGYVIGDTDMAEVRYPGDRRDCQQCHIPATYTLPLPAGQLATQVPHNWWSPVLPVASACLSCHDSIEAAAHAILNTASFGEACAVCHKESADFAVSKAHAR